MVNFNPHSHAGSDRILPHRQICAFISIHTPTQGVTGSRQSIRGNPSHFNPHSHAGSDLHRRKHRMRQIHFNPHSHAGSDMMGGTMASVESISIHTPTQGVTLNREIAMFDSCISIHTPTQGVTKVFSVSQIHMVHFNPHSHAGSDRRRISPTRAIKNFNPHSHAGSDAFEHCDLTRVAYFNPHSHAGSDGSRQSTRGIPSHFNPHSHAGSDQAFL